VMEPPFVLMIWSRSDGVVGYVVWVRHHEKRACRGNALGTPRVAWGRVRRGRWR
jgi:hypothetical protein